VRITRTTQLLAIVVGLALAGCGDSTDVASSTTDTTATTAPDGVSTTTTTGGTDDTTTTTVTDGIDPLEGAGTDPVSGDGTGFGQLTDVEIGRHEGYDRVVFTFADDLPGYRVEYVEPPIIEDGSGETLDVEGDAFLAVRLEPSSGFDQDAGVESYTGPDEILGTSAGTSVLREVQRTGDFEAVLGWALGLSDRVDFKVTTLSSPTRLVIDVRNH
jgi:hypothetical protein